MFRHLTYGLLVLAVVAAVVGWWNRDAWLASFNEEQQAQTTAFKQQGRAFATGGADQQTCLDEALSRFDGCLGYACTVNHGVFLKACLNEAAPTPGFCDGVPEFRDKPTEDDKSWAKHACWNRDIRGEGCRLLMRQQSYFCSQKDT